MLGISFTMREHLPEKVVVKFRVVSCNEAWDNVCVSKGFNGCCRLERKLPPWCTLHMIDSTRPLHEQVHHCTCANPSFATAFAYMPELQTPTCTARLAA